MQYLGRTGPIVNDAAAFTPSMSKGYQPERPNRFVRQLGWSVSQTTHVAAPLDPAMSLGAQPDQKREYLPLRTGWSVSQLTHTSAAFIPAMVAGWHPDWPRPIQPKPWNLGWSTSQLTHVEAAFTQSMILGVHPDRFRETLPLRRGFTWWPPDIESHSVEMFVGVHPDRPRLFFAPRLPLPWSQTTHTEAAFSQEMIAGAHPERFREFLPLRRGFAWWPPDIESHSIEMFVGSHPDQPRLFLAPKIPLPWSQTTHVASAIDPNLLMLVGTRPDRFRERLPIRLGWFVGQHITPIAAPGGGSWIGWVIARGGWF